MKFILAFLSLMPTLAFANPNYSRFAGSYKVISFQYKENDQPSPDKTWGKGVEIYVRGDELCVKEIKHDGFTVQHCMQEGHFEQDDNSAGWPGQILETTEFTENSLDHHFTFAAVNEPIYQQGRILIVKNGNQYIMTSTYEEGSSMDNFSDSREYVLEKN